MSGNGNESIGLAWLISGGTAVDRDENLATAWFILAAAQGHPNAELRLPAGELQSLARRRAALAATFLSAFELSDAEQVLKTVIATGSEPMNT